MNREVNSFRIRLTACLGVNEMAFLTLGGAVRQTIGTRSTFRLPLKTLGYNGSKLCGRSVASKLTSQQGVTFFCRRTLQNAKNAFFVVKRSVTEIFQNEDLSGWKLSESS